MRALLLTTLALTGCTSVGVEIEHNSHPLAGWPVSARDTEDSLSQANVIARWQKGRVYAEQGLGVNLRGENGGGFFGPELTYTARVGVQLWSR